MNIDLLNDNPSPEHRSTVLIEPIFVGKNTFRFEDFIDQQLPVDLADVDEINSEFYLDVDQSMGPGANKLCP